ncbi:hypothetical protein I7I48_09258 [Histoplasma ohiense]|nr:hypothetical protein I7I48_09258 [Histoplasma ohiense (nom. inval.)]
MKKNENIDSKTGEDNFNKQMQCSSQPKIVNNNKHQNLPKIHYNISRRSILAAPRHRQQSILVIRDTFLSYI